MDWGAIASTAADIAGKWWQSNEASQEAEKNRDWQRDLADTAYQRSVTDLRKAGLNPMIAAKVGGASVPSGAVASVPDTGNIGSSAYANYQRSQEIKKLNADTQNVQADTANKISQSRLIDSQTKLNESSAFAVERRGSLDSQLWNESWERTVNLKSERARIEATTRLVEGQLRMLGVSEREIEARTELLKNQAQESKYSLSRGRRTSEMYEGPAGGLIPYLDPVGKAIGSAGSLYQLGR